MPQSTSLWFESALVGATWGDRVRLSISDGRIARVDCDVAPGPGDTRHGIAIPGVTNLHSHAFQRGMAGLAEVRGPSHDSFWTWREIMYRFLSLMTPDDVEAVAALAYMEMLETGFTRVAEFHYLHHQPSGAPYANPAEMAERIAAAGAGTGISVALLPCFYAHGGIGGDPPVAGQRRFITSLDQFASLVERSAAIGNTAAFRVAGLSPHSLRAVTEAEIRAVIEMAGRGVIHMHVSEQPKEVDDCLAWSGRRPVEWLLETFELGPQWCLIHATHTTEAELARAAARSVIMGLCPITEANLGDGIFKTAHWLSLGPKGGGAFGVGTDSNVLIGVADELRQLEYAQRLVTGQRNAIASVDGQSSGALLFQAALDGGARAVGLPAADCRLTVGSIADIVELDSEHVALAGRAGDALIDGWIFGANRSAIRTVWSRGERVVADGRHIDRDAISERYRAVIRRVMR